MNNESLSDRTLRMFLDGDIDAEQYLRYRDFQDKYGIGRGPSGGGGRA